MRATSVRIARGDARAKLALIRLLVEHAKRDPRFHRIAHAIPRHYGIPGYDWLGELGAVKRFVDERIRYARDPHRLETFRSPQTTLRIGAGDCDDMVTLGIALCETLGYATRSDVIRGTRRNGWTHIKFDAGVPPGGRVERWVAMELTMPHYRVGQDAPRALVAERLYGYADGRLEHLPPRAPRVVVVQGVGGSVVSRRWT